MSISQAPANYKLRKTQQHKRNVSARHWKPGKLTHFNTGIFTKIASYRHLCHITCRNVSIYQDYMSHVHYRLNYFATGKFIILSVEMYQFTRIPMPRWNMSFMLQNFAQRTLIRHHQKQKSISRCVHTETLVLNSVDFSLK